PGNFVLHPESAGYAALRFGQVNILALQLGEAIHRNRRLDAFDPAHAYHWPYPHVLIPAYFQEIAVGEEPAQTQTFAVASTERLEVPEGNLLRMTLQSDDATLHAEVTYRPVDDGKTLIKSVTLTNCAETPIRLRSVRLGDYRTATAVTEGDMGFPVYAAGCYFFSLDHPAGWAMGEDGRVQLRQFPGALLQPGESFVCMNAVMGVAAAGKAREAFLAHLTPRMRRVRRHLDKPFAMLEMFGGWPIAPDLMLGDELSEEVCLDYAHWLREFHEKTGETFDLVSVDFWQDPHADLIQFNHRFPNGFAAARSAFAQAGTAYGLWIDSSMFPRWHIGLNPLALNCLAGQPSYASPNGLNSGWGGANPVCRAAEPIRSIFTHAFLHHVREGGARLLKFDNLVSMCHNQCHGHWPGVYSTQAIYDSVIEFLQALDDACPDVLLMLYWGYRSPWWLLHGDTVFEAGLKIEAASPSPTPSRYIRDGVALTLDQAAVFAADIPRLGKDSLGIWLSCWPWNSSIGTERWREGMIMDLCRGSLLFQPWMGEDTLGDDELQDLAGFLRLLRHHAACFAHPQLILGDPWRNEPYGYLCADGRRAFVAVNNFSWGDYPIAFATPETFGLANDFTVFRHYPEPARLSARADDAPADCLRPFQVALYELVPTGESPSVDRHWPDAAPCRAFAEPSVVLAVEATEAGVRRVARDESATTAGVYDVTKASHDLWRDFSVIGRAPYSQHGGTLVVAAVATQDGQAVPTGSIGAQFKASALLNGITAVGVPVLPDKTYPATWQAWRMATPPNAAPEFSLSVSTCLEQAVALAFHAWFIPTES
ncbi:MAG TPA: hypothetical protein VGL77_05960, partial [Armatimonadota bacterium]